jgi:hypothetical protein
MELMAFRIGEREEVEEEGWIYGSLHYCLDRSARY